MISQIRSKLACTLPAIALLGWLAVDQSHEAFADAAKSATYVDDAVKRLQESDAQAAIIQLKNALREAPENVEARRLLGEIYLNQGRFPEAEKELERAHEKAPNTETTILLARTLLGQGNADGALELVEAAKSAEPERNRALALLRANALLSLNRPADAREALAAEIEANPLNIDISLADAQISLAERDIEAAKIKVGRALEIDPESVQAWMLDARIKSGEGRYDDALASLDRLSELAPGNSGIKVMRAEVLIRRAKFDDAENTVMEVLSRRPDDVAANYLLATVQSNKGELEAADATLRKIADVARNSNEVTLLSGVVKLGIGQHGQAEALLARYVNAAPQNLPVRRLLAGLQLKQGSPRAAIDTLRPVTGSESSDVISLQLKSSAEIQVGNIDGARRALSQLVDLGKAPSAVQAATLLSVLNSDDRQMTSEEVRLDIARVLDRMRNGEGKEAFDAARALADEYPDNPFALNLFGMTHLVSGGGEKAARDLFERASRDYARGRLHAETRRRDRQYRDWQAGRFHHPRRRPACGRSHGAQGRTGARHGLGRTRASAMTPLPLTVIGGYLGAGKTTLINRILAADHGRRLLVLVNDFGAINIDADLLISATDDTIALSNGCVCCTMGADLFMAVGDVLDRPARPDHLIVEASGIADPARIARLALAEPDLRYAGIVTVVDGTGFPALAEDPLIGQQITGQVLAADLIAVSKTPPTERRVAEALAQCGADRILSADDANAVLRLVLDLPLQNLFEAGTQSPHPDYAQWSETDVKPMSRCEIEQRLHTRPKGIFRLKGLIPDSAGGAWQVQVVGGTLDLSHRAGAAQPGLVAIGLSGTMSPREVDAWWHGGGD